MMSYKSFHDFPILKVHDKYQYKYIAEVLENVQLFKYYLQSMIFSVFVTKVYCLFYYYNITYHKYLCPEKKYFESPNNYGNAIKNPPTTGKPVVQSLQSPLCNYHTNTKVFRQEKKTSIPALPMVKEKEGAKMSA